MRSVCNQIVKFNETLPDRPSLKLKIDTMASSAFSLFRGTFHLFARDMTQGQFGKWPCLEASGQIVGDLHTENFGTFRCINGEIVYDINDFDETTKAPYEYDLRRLLVSLVLSSLENSHPFGQGVLAAEACLRAYLDTLRRLEKLATRADFEQLKERKEVRAILSKAAEKSRVDMMRNLAHEKEPGKFQFVLGEKLLPISDADRAEAALALPKFAKSCLAPKDAHPEQYTLQDVAFRIAGCGSLGRKRYAALLGKGKSKTARETWNSLRLIEWKDSLDSSLDSPIPHAAKNRAREVLKATLAFQVLPKRYLGWTTWDGNPMQARELGANDSRFAASEFKDLDGFHRAARTFGEVTARAHLVSTLGKRGPRAILKELKTTEDRWIRRMAAFSAAYADRILDDYEEFRAGRAEVEEALVGAPTALSC